MLSFADGARGQLLRGRRPRGRRVRRDRDRVRGDARVRHLPRLRELRHLALRRRGRGEVVAQQFETAQFLPAAARQPLSDALVCYARTVVYERVAADALRRRLANLINPWGVAMFKTMQTVEPKAASEQAAFGKWLDQRSDRQTARSDRTHGAEGVIPVPLWIVLFLSAGIIFVFMLFFADSGERRGRPGNDDGRRHGGDQRRCCSCSGSSTTRITPASAGCRRRRWSGRSRSSTSRQRSRDHVRRDVRRARGCALRLRQVAPGSYPSAAERQPLVQHRRENRADHERARSEVDREEEREDRARRAVDLAEVGRPGEVPAETDLHRLKADRCGASAEQGGAPARTVVREKAVEADEDEERETRVGRRRRRRMPKPNGCQPSASLTFWLNLLTTFSSIETITAQRIRPSAPSTSSALTSRPRTSLRATPSSKTTASVFCTEFITPVAPQRASPSATRPARLQGDGTAAIRLSSLSAPEAESPSWSRDRRDEILPLRARRPRAPGRGSWRRTSRAARGRRARDRRSRLRTGSLRAARSARSPRGRGRRARAEGTRARSWEGPYPGTALHLAPNAVATRRDAVRRRSGSARRRSAQRRARERATRAAPRRGPSATTGRARGSRLRALRR